MPHIQVLFIEQPEVRNFLRKNKSKIRTIIAGVLEYPLEDVAFIPNAISSENLELADNLLPIEFTVNSGTRTLEREDEYAGKIEQSLIDKFDFLAATNFGVWLISHGKNGFVEHKAQKSRP